MTTQHEAPRAARELIAELRADEWGSAPLDWIRKQYGTDSAKSVERIDSVIAQIDAALAAVAEGERLLSLTLGKHEEQRLELWQIGEAVSALSKAITGDNAQPSGRWGGTLEMLAYLLHAVKNRPQPAAPDQHAGANAAGQGLSAREAEQFAIGYYFSCAGFPRIAPHDEPTKARDAWLSGWDVAKLVGQGGDAKAVEQRRIPQFCGGAWMDYFEQARLVDGTSGNVIDDMQHAFDAGWQAATAALAQSDATAPLNSLLHLEPWRITRRPGGLHIACSGTAQTDAILAALGGV